jgi:ketosteroid isomerase-like protein
LEELSRGDIDALLEDAADDFEFVNPDYALEPGTRHGREGARTAFENLAAAFEDMRWVIERIEEEGDRVIVTGNWAGRGKASGAEFEGEPFAVVVTYRGEQAVRLEWFNRPEQALTSRASRGAGP